MLIICGIPTTDWRIRCSVHDVEMVELTKDEYNAAKNLIGPTRQFESHEVDHQDAR